MKKTILQLMAWFSFAAVPLALVLFVVDLATGAHVDVVTFLLPIAALLSLWAGLNCLKLVKEVTIPKPAEEISRRERRAQALLYAGFPLFLVVIAFRLYILLLVAIPLAVWAYFHPEAVEKIVASIDAKLKTRKQP